ncbi:MAG: acetylxylan esterase [Bacteroidaceae bacterium]|nr:acetylxylan esterase [Bacteroidaceae bacterium]
MKGSKLFALAALMLAASAPANAQFFMFGGGSSASRDSLNRIAAEDYADMLGKLGIGNPREGRQPNSPDESKHPNYSELTANPYIFYPEALVTNAGKPVKSARMWNKVRRPEIVKMFEDEVYGHIPENVPGVTWKVTSEEKKDYQGIPVVVRNLAGVVDNSIYPAISVEIQAQIMWPQSVNQEFQKAGVPVIMEFGFISSGNSPMMMARPSAQPSWQQMALDRGWACATINPSSIQADAGSGLTNGIIGLCNKGQHRSPSDWGALRAWGWGASRFIDYLETCQEFDATKTAIEGVSRYGKAALVAMAFEPRIAAGFIASSGKGGAAGWRRDCGESIGNIVSNEEYHWVCGNLIKYGTDPMTENDLPVDQHELIALCAPRACFISTGTFDGDKWQDVVGSFISASKASPVYELLGCKGLGSDVFPGVDNDELMDGPLAYRQHHGGHEAGPNWPVFLSYFFNQVVDKP